MAPNDLWTREELDRQGFVGWITFPDLVAELPALTQHGGVYVIVRQSRKSPAYLPANPGGRFKGKDPTVTADALAANWVNGAEVIYIGKANNLRQRLRQYQRFGDGFPVGHWGGRLIWQLADAKDLLVAWRETPGEIPVEVETRLIAEFRSTHGKPPFANDPHRLGR